MKKTLIMAAILTVSTTIMAEENIASQRLNESVISTENFETSVLDTAKNITIVTQEDIQNKGASTVAEALKGVPGLTISSIGGSDSVFDMRGSGATAKSNTLVLLDGIPLNAVDGTYNTSQIPVEQIDKIEIIPSGGAVMYGDGTTGGVINIITKSPLDKNNYGNVGIEIGSWNTVKGNVNYGTKIGDKFLFDLSYNNYKSDGYRSLDSRYASGDTRESIWLRGKYLLDDGYLEAKYNYGKNKDSWTSALTKEQFEENSKQTGKDAGKELNKTNNYMMTYNKKIGENLSFLIYGGYDTKKLSPKATWGDSRTDIKQYYIKPQLKYNYGKESYLILGGDYKKSEVERFTYKTKLEKESFAGYLINKTTIGKLQLSQGYRRSNDKYNDKSAMSKGDLDKKFDNDSFELAANYLYSETGSVYFSFTQGFRTPNADDLGYWYGDIDVQETKAYELGIKDMYKNTFISSSIFLIDTDKEIYYEKVSGYGGKNRNFDGKVRRIGGQISLQHYFDKLTLRENISYIQPKITSGIHDGKEFAGVARWQGNIGMSYNILSNMIFNIDGYYFGKAYNSDDFSNKLGKNDDYITVDSNIRYKFNDGFEIYGGIRNLFDKEYANAVVTVGTGEKAYHPADGRSYYAGFKYSF